MPSFRHGVALCVFGQWLGPDPRLLDRGTNNPGGPLALPARCRTQMGRRCCSHGFPGARWC